MDDKGTQVSLGCKRTLKCNKGSQTLPESTKQERGTQCGSTAGSYGRHNIHKKWRFEDLLMRMFDKERLMEWMMDEGLLVKKQLCGKCRGEMNLVKCEDRSDGYKWECRKQINSKRHREGDVNKEWKLVCRKQHDIRRNVKVHVLVVSRS